MLFLCRDHYLCWKQNTAVIYIKIFFIALIHFQVVTLQNIKT